MAENEVTRPEFVEDRHLNFLDELRDSGVTNMFGASPYLERAYVCLNAKTARAILSYWMKSYGERHPKQT